ncbi:MAG TPA: N-acetylmuramoyl-L-alanine amidase-like domain-containing protein [Nitrospirota bacterium]|nr:N-acetylmuramoyl-L-alanine amidase-like domain-containing protein [Nitrospirota bacterium]
MITHLGKWTTALIDRITYEAAGITDNGERIDFISRQLLYTPYKKSSLIGSISVPEVLIINLEGMDCITFIEYVEAMRLSTSFSEFTENLKMVRYRNGEVTYERRRHFFTDWVGYTPQTVEDVTSKIGATNTVRVRKKLNLRSDGAYLLPGICVTEREISFIPVNALDNTSIGRLKTGDYAGVYSDKEGLDVTHTGIFIINDDGKVYLRHASSRQDTNKVIDEELTGYLTGKDGLIILRPI